MDWGDSCGVGYKELPHGFDFATQNLGEKEC